MNVTICTPTYNRAYCLEELYLSLCNQTNFDFEWIIVDDGSSDNTKELVQSWDSKFFSLKYIYKENGGKHTAVNVGVENACGKYFIIVDSDDILKSYAVESIIEGFKNLPIGYAGIAFNKAFTDGSLVGSTFDGEYKDATSLERPKYNIYGDKAECFFTDILRKYPFPVFKGERFLTEAVVWNRIAADGLKIRWYNEIIYLCEYRADGLTMNSSGSKNFRGYTLFIKELLSYDQTSLKEKIKWLGVYSYTARMLPMTDRKISEAVKSNIVMVKTSRWLYSFKRKITKTTREKEYRIKR